MGIFFEDLFEWLPILFDVGASVGFGRRLGVSVEDCVGFGGGLGVSIGGRPGTSVGDGEGTLLKNNFES